MAIEFDGLVIRFGQRHVLAYGPDANALGPALLGSPTFIEPGYKLVGANDYLLPDAAIDDRGQRYHGPAAAEWIETRGGAFPRADAVGRLASGERLDLRLKELDLASLALFASARAGGPPVRLDLAIEALAVPDGLALTPVSAPIGLDPFGRALRFYRLAPGTFGAVSAGLIQQLLATQRANWLISFDDLDNSIMQD